MILPLSWGPGVGGNTTPYKIHVGSGLWFCGSGGGGGGGGGAKPHPPSTQNVILSYIDFIGVHEGGLFEECQDHSPEVFRLSRQQAMDGRK